MAPSLAENANEQIGRSVEHPGSVEPARRAGNMPFDTHQMLETVETSKLFPYLCDNIKCCEPRGCLTIFLGELSSHPSGVMRLARFDWKLPRDEQKIAGAHKSRVVSRRPGRGRQFQ